MTKDDCTVTHQDHEKELQDMKQRHQNFYQTLCNCIDGEE